MKKLLALLLAVVLCLSLAACATTPKDTATDTTPADTAADTAKDDAADNTADDSNASEPAAEGGKNIVWAGWSGEEEASKDIFQRMMKTYEDASGNTVTWVGWTWADTAQQLLIRTQGGEQLDLAQADIGIFNTIAAAGVLADWNEILGEDYLKENFEQSALDVGNIDGKQLGLPWSMASITMVYNPEILAAAGWDTVPTTIEEFEQCMADIKAYNPEIIPYAVSTKDATCAGDFMPWLWTFGGAIFNEDGTVAIDSDAAVKCVEWYQKLMNEGYIAMDTGRGEARQMFAQGRRGRCEGTGRQQWRCAGRRCQGLLCNVPPGSERRRSAAVHHVGPHARHIPELRVSAGSCRTGEDPCQRRGRHGLLREQRYAPCHQEHGCEG